MSTFIVTAEQAKTRLDALVRELGQLSQKKAKILCTLGGVAINGVCAAATARVREGSKVTFQVEYLDLMLSLGLPVAFADEHVIVLQKPPGLAVQSSPTIDTSVTSTLERELPDSELVHHLDREASGLLLVGRTAFVADQLSGVDCTRWYEAIVEGSVTAEQQTIELPIPASEGRANANSEDVGQTGRLQLTVLARREGATHVRVTLEQGPTRQIRPHLHAIGHPILGDARYGGEAANEHARATFGVHRALLHASRLQFTHPISEVVIDVTAADEPDFARIFPQRNR